MEFIVLTPAELEGILSKVLDRYTTKLPGDEPAGAKEIIGTKLLCSRLNITEPTIIRWRKTGKIPFLLIGTSIRYDWQAVVKALESKAKK